MRVFYPSVLYLFIEGEKTMKTIKEFISHPLFKDFFIREAGVFAPETECYRFSVTGHSDIEVSVIRSSMTYGGIKAYSN